MNPYLKVLQVGEELTHTVAWKNGQALASLLAAIAAIAMSFGIDFGITNDQLLAFSGGIAALVNAYLVYATSRDVGVMPAARIVQSVSNPPDADT